MIHFSRALLFGDEEIQLRKFLFYRATMYLMTYISYCSNIPEDQRIIDPKKGPIRKTAAVKNLPSLETT